MTRHLAAGPDRFEIQWHCPGISDKPVLVFLHEGLGCIAMWKEFPEALCRATGCPGFVFSRLGYGNSDTAPLPWKINFMHTQALKVLPRVLRAAGINEHIIIGHSDGGSIGIMYGGSPLTGGLKGLITEAAHVFCEPLTIASIEAAREAYLHKDLKQGLAKYHGANTDTAFWGWNNVWLHPNFIHWNIEKYLGRIQVPVLALQGRDDQYGTVEQLTAIENGIPDCTARLIDNCRHSPHLEQPETVLSLMSQFISKL